MKLGNRIRASNEGFDPHQTSNAIGGGLLPIQMVNALGQELQDSERQIEAHVVLDEMSNALDVADDLEAARDRLNAQSEVSQDQAKAVMESLTWVCQSMHLYGRHERKNPRYTTEALPTMRQRNYKAVVVAALEGVMGDIWQGIKNFFKKIYDWVAGLFSSNGSSASATSEESKKIDELAATTEKAAEAAGAGDARATQSTVMKNSKAKEELLAELNKKPADDGKDGHEQNWKEENGVLMYHPKEKIRGWLFVNETSPKGLADGLGHLSNALKQMTTLMGEMKQMIPDMMLEFSKNTAGTSPDKLKAMIEKQIKGTTDIYQELKILDSDLVTTYPSPAPLILKIEGETMKFETSATEVRYGRLAIKPMPLMDAKSQLALGHAVDAFTDEYKKFNEGDYTGFLKKVEQETEKLTKETTGESVDKAWAAMVQKDTALQGLDDATLAAKKTAFMSRFNGNTTMRSMARHLINDIQCMIRLIGHISKSANSAGRIANSIRHDHLNARARLTAKWAHLSK